MPQLSEAQKQNIRERMLAIGDMQGTLGAMSNLLRLVEEETRDADGDVVNPWLDVDSDLSEAIALWNIHKTVLQVKLTALP